MPRRNPVKDEGGFTTAKIPSLQDNVSSSGRAAARMTAMTNSKNYEQGKELGGYQAALQAINTASGRTGI